MLADAGRTVVEVNRPDRQARRSRGKSDTVDAQAAALAALSGRAGAVPKSRDGIVQSIRVIGVASRSTRRQMTRIEGQITHLIVTAPEELRIRLQNLSTPKRIERAAALRPGPDKADVAEATRTGLRTLARQWLMLRADHTELRGQLSGLTAQTSPTAGTAAIAQRITPEAARRLLESDGHRIDRPAVVAHVLLALITEESTAERSRRAQAEAAAERRRAVPEVAWRAHVADLTITARRAWLRTPEGQTWAEQVERMSQRARRSRAWVVWMQQALSGDPTRRINYHPARWVSSVTAYMRPVSRDRRYLPSQPSGRTMTSIGSDTRSATS